jgi:hypothetical protein
VVKQLEERLKLVENRDNKKSKDQSKQLQEALQPAIMNAVTQRLDSFEREVQARMLLATAVPPGGSQRYVQAAGAGSDASPVRQTSSQAQLEQRLKQFEDLVQNTISELTNSEKAKQSCIESDVTSTLQK